MDIDLKDVEQVLTWNRKLHERHDFISQVRIYGHQNNCSQEAAYEAIEEIHKKLTGARKWSCFDSFKKAQYRQNKI